MDEAELALMLADLDNSRRDGLSAPDERQSRRGATSSRGMAQAAEQESARRKERLAGPATNERHAAIQAWNDPERFSRDEAAEQTTNWGDGQIHRGPLTKKMGDGGLGAHTDSYHHERRPRIQQVDMPRAVRDSNRTRAPSPRGAGVTRWVNGVAVQSTAPAVQRPVARPIPSTAHVAPSPARNPMARPTSSISPAPPPPVRELVASSRSSTASVASTPPLSRPPPLAPSAPHPPATHPAVSQVTPVTAPRPVARTAALSPVVSNTLPERQQAREPAIKEEASGGTENLLVPSSQMARQPAITNGSVKNTESLPSPPDSSERPRPKSYGASALDYLSTAATVVKDTLSGIFSVNYYDSEGTHRGNRRVEIAAPVKVNVNVRAKGEYDPLQMADEMEALAKHMIRDF